MRSIDDQNAHKESRRCDTQRQMLCFIYAAVLCPRTFGTHAQFTNESQLWALNRHNVIGS